MFFCWVFWIGTSVYADPLRTDGFAVLAIDAAAQRAVVRPMGKPPILVAKGAAIPGTRVRITAIMADRIEVEDAAPGGPRRRIWWTLTGVGTATVGALDAKPRMGGASTMPTHGVAMTVGRP